jgi:hypothetical protein
VDWTYDAKRRAVFVINCDGKWLSVGRNRCRPNELRRSGWLQAGTRVVNHYTTWSNGLRRSRGAVAPGAVLERIIGPHNRQTPLNPQTLPGFSNRYVLAAEIAHSHLYQQPTGFNLVELVELALSAPRADAASVFPVIWRFQIRVPEGPGAALAGTGLIDSAFAGLAVEKHAITGWKLFEALASPYAANVLVLEFFDAKADSGGEGLELFVIDPNEAGRPGAAVAALGAFKAQASVIPGEVGHKSVASFKFHVSSLNCPDSNLKLETWNL